MIDYETEDETARRQGSMIAIGGGHLQIATLDDQIERLKREKDIAHQNAERLKEQWQLVSDENLRLRQEIKSFWTTALLLLLGTGLGVLGLAAWRRKK
jgi:hypothetical protein